MKARLAALATALLLAAAAWSAALAQPAPSAAPDAAFAAELATARRAAGAGCKEDAVDRLVRILCRGKLRVGVRTNYPLFAGETAQGLAGYEIDIARAIAAALGVDLVLVPVTPANRIAMLGEDRIDLTIATMGHTSLRDGQARFIRPHYYQSQTVVVGPRGRALTDFDDLAGQTICVTVGNASNAELSGHNARLMLFDSPAKLVERLSAQACQLAAQDDSFFAAAFTDPAFAARYETKFGFAPVPWGMAVGREGTEHLAQLLSNLSARFHRDGIFLNTAATHGIATGFLERQRSAWSGHCNSATALQDGTCLAAPLVTAVPATPWAGQVDAIEAWIEQRLGLRATLAMFKMAPAWELVRNGAINSGLLILGVSLATPCIAVLIGLALGFGGLPLRWLAQGVCVLMQSCPVVLTLVIAAALCNHLVGITTLSGLITAIIALGLINGSYAGRAIADAVASLRGDAAKRDEAPVPPHRLFREGLARAETQIGAFIINAIKGTPIASFIGVPELLNALTDTASFSAERATTYWLLLVFYTLAVLLLVPVVQALGGLLRNRASAR
jgi:hypothetical protein